MTPDDLLLENYIALKERIDHHTRQAGRILEAHMACKKGCDGCCRHLSLFPVEAYALSRAFVALPRTDRNRVIRAAKVADLKDDPVSCPLLIDRACMLYPARPVICRTHGFPVYIEKEGEPMVDFCPKNFTSLTSFPKETLLSLEHLNTLLSSVNTLFISQLRADLPERIPISRALFLFQDLETQN